MNHKILMRYSTDKKLRVLNENDLLPLPIHQVPYLLLLSLRWYWNQSVWLWQCGRGIFRFQSVLGQAVAHFPLGCLAFCLESRVLSRDFLGHSVNHAALAPGRPLD